MTLAFAFFSGCNNTDNSNIENSEQPEYIFATNYAVVPYVYSSEYGENIGIEVELLEEISKLENFTYKIKNYDFDQVLASLENNQAVAIFGGIEMSEKYMEKYSFSKPTFISGTVMAVKSNSTIKNIAELNGKTVAVKANTTAEEYANQIKDTYNFTVKPMKTSSDALLSVAKGTSFACFNDYGITGFFAKVTHQIKIVTDIQKQRKLGFAFLKGENEDMLNKLNNGLDYLKSTGKYQEIVDKYISEWDEIYD